MADCDALLRAVRGAVEAAGGRRIGLSEFLAQSGMKREDVLRDFTEWGEVLKAAGHPMVPARLLEDWGRVARFFRHAPTRREYKKWGKQSWKLLKLRLRGWENIPDAFHTFASDQSQWVDVMRWVPRRRELPDRHRVQAVAKSHQEGRLRAPRRMRRRRRKNRHIYGAPLDFGALRHAPANENGVILLFGAVAERLGFLIESVRTAFPDCEAKCEVSPGVWEGVRVEFEFESRNFRLHGHDPKGCDLIVCWEHNWPECPVEVLELKGEVARLRAEINRRGAETQR